MSNSLRDTADRAAIALFFSGAMFFSMFVIMLGFNAINHAPEKACYISSCENGTLTLQLTEPMLTGKFDGFDCNGVQDLTYYRCFPWDGKLYLQEKSKPNVPLIVCFSVMIVMLLAVMIGAVYMCYDNARKYAGPTNTEPSPEPSTASVNIQLEEV